MEKTLYRILAEEMESRGLRKATDKPRLGDFTYDAVNIGGFGFKIGTAPNNTLVYWPRYEIHNLDDEDSKAFIQDTFFRSNFANDGLFGEDLFRGNADTLRIHLRYMGEHIILGSKHERIIEVEYNPFSHPQRKVFYAVPNNEKTVLERVDEKVKRLLERLKEENLDDTSLIKVMMDLYQCDPLLTKYRVYVAGEFKVMDEEEYQKSGAAGTIAMVKDGKPIKWGL